MHKEADTDFLVIGSGIAGLAFAINTARNSTDARITVLSKTKIAESNTRYAQGGIAVVTDRNADSFEAHIADTLKAGDGLCDKEVVGLVIREAPDRLADLVSWGMSFDASKSGDYDLAREGGHTAARILHTGDFTGRAVEECLIREAKKQPRIRVLEYHMAVDLLMNGDMCAGVSVLDDHGRLANITAAITVIASGGLGQVYAHTTNPPVATGDGIAMAARAGAEIKDMEFVQFHPTALYEEGHAAPFLISEAVRGFGAYLLNAPGERFMVRYDDRGELASRDIVSRAIVHEMSRTGSACVYLDCRHLDRAAFKSHFPTIDAKLISIGIDISKDLIPVVPSAHYSCGGIATDHYGRTTIGRLYACGEVARTGLHGANRLASNSLSEALVFAYRASVHAIGSLNVPADPGNNKVRNGVSAIAVSPSTSAVMIAHIQRIMSSIAVHTNDASLRRALKDVISVETELMRSPRGKMTTAAVRVQNIVCVSKLVLSASIARRDSKGAFFKSDVSQLA